MVVVPLASSGNESPHMPAAGRKCDSVVWMRVAAAGSLAAAGVLLMAGKRRAGLAMAAAGTTLTAMDQQETVRTWWNRAPGYLAEAQSILTRVQGAVDELSVQGERLRAILSRQ
jgi:hypothetical protein